MGKMDKMGKMSKIGKNLSVSLSVRPSVHLPIHPSVCQSVCPQSLRPSVSPAVRQSVCPSLGPSFRLLSVRQSVRLSVCPSVCPSVRPSIGFYRGIQAKKCPCPTFVYPNLLVLDYLLHTDPSGLAVANAITAISRAMRRLRYIAVIRVKKYIKKCRKKK